MAKLVYDSLGKIISVKQLSTNIKFFPTGYKAVFPDDYYLSGHWPTSGGTTFWYMDMGHNLQSDGGRYFSCVTKTLLNPAIDGFGNEFYVGELFDFIKCTPNVLVINDSTQISGVTGTTDIFYIKRNVSGDVGGSTKNNGYTNESPAASAVDSVTKTLYVIGSFSKVADTSRFRFGNSVLINKGNGTTSDVLLLKFGYSSGSLLADAGINKTICWGGSTQLSPNVSGGSGSGSYMYRWSPSTGLSDTTIQNPIANPTGTTKYILTVKDGTSATATDSVKIIVDSTLYRPVIYPVDGTNPFCEGKSVTLGTLLGPTNLEWSNGGTALNITVERSDTITLKATSGGCRGISLPFITVMKPRTAPPTISPSGNPTICAGEKITLTAQSTGRNVSYSWNTGATTASITVSTSGTYTVVATDTSGCASSASSKTVTLANLPTGTITGSTTICEGDSVQLTLATSNGNSIIWNTGATTSSIWVKNAGSYSAQITSLQGCSNTSNSFTTVVRQKPVPVISQKDNLLSVSSAYASYQWYLKSDLLQGATSPSLTITHGGNYSIKVTSSDGCSGEASLTAVLRIINSDFSYQVYPNPPDNKLNIIYTLKDQQNVSITIKNFLGQPVYPLVNDQLQQAGTYELVVNDLRRKMKESFYVIEFKIGNKIISHKLVLSN